LKKGHSRDDSYLNSEVLYRSTRWQGNVSNPSAKENEMEQTPGDHPCDWQANPTRIIFSNKKIAVFVILVLWPFEGTSSPTTLSESSLEFRIENSEARKSI
jgi:hypothetical protein